MVSSMRRATSIQRYARTSCAAASKAAGADARALRAGMASTFALGFVPRIEQHLSDARGRAHPRAVFGACRSEHVQARLEGRPVGVLHHRRMQDLECRCLGGWEQLLVAEHEQLLLAELSRR